MKFLVGLSLLSLIPSSFAVPTASKHRRNELAQAEQPLIKLKPQRTSSRDLVNLDGLWKFTLASGANDTSQPWSAPFPRGALECPVPASYNDIFVDRDIHDHVGWVYYQREVFVPKGWSKEQYFVRAESATHHGRIYVNDRLLAEHVGGYTPFEADITEFVTAGEMFRLTIGVNNELTHETIPPGKIEIGENTGKRIQTYNHDFYNYAGLSRSIWLYSVPRQHIEDITVVTDVDGETGLINYNIKVAKNSTENIRISVIDEDGVVVATASGAQGTVKINSVRLWQPGAAYLYQFQANIVDGRNKVVDTYSVATGVRTVKVDGSKFLINGKPFYFTGFGRHEDTTVRGKGHDQAYMVHDFQLMDWIGANSFRTSHYPYAEEVMDFADRQGIVVIDETPAVGLNIGLMGVSGSESPKTWSEENINNNTQKAHKQAIRELISRDKNHASVVMWSIANEPASEEDGAREYFEPLAKLTRKLDPTRPITFANVGLATYELDLISDLFDVSCLNRYFGWYSETGDLEEAEPALVKELQGWEKKFNKPIIMTEYGADTIAGLHSTLGLPWSEEFQEDMLAMYHRVFDSIESMAGEHVWNFADFQTTLGTKRVDGNKKGVFTRDRKPKMAAHGLKARWTNMTTSG
ncbi:hypothetical protein N7537_011758 [Penicillium hordei]|uniref:Beta-glucuronidase n=1 Tax=Penicillium hordei TaxID=40994 RepID=A0AAD6GUD0_9EURO|nr:uncharacterized protein N7537_011758 [Penicillium hordei]KAJ5589080.1 hypothetical protein N7537_011758 [Penicillium hordei]